MNTFTMEEYLNLFDDIQETFLRTRIKDCVGVVVLNNRVVNVLCLEDGTFKQEYLIFGKPKDPSAKSIDLLSKYFSYRVDLAQDSALLLNISCGKSKHWRICTVNNVLKIYHAGFRLLYFELYEGYIAPMIREATIFNERLIFDFDEITNEELLKVYNDQVQRAAAKEEAVKKKLSMDPVFCLFDTIEMKFNYLGCLSETGSLRQPEFSKKNGKVNFDFSKKLAAMLLDDENFVHIPVQNRNYFIIRTDVLFRPIKPENIIIVDGGRWLVIDKKFPEILLSTQNIALLKEYGEKYFKNPEDYYNWVLQLELAG